jgi:hypothetical protein
MWFVNDTKSISKTPTINTDIGGVALAAGGAGATIKTQVNDIVKDIYTSLTAGKRYYYDHVTQSLTTTVTNYKIGYSLSSNEMLLTFNGKNVSGLSTVKRTFSVDPDIPIGSVVTLNGSTVIRARSTSAMIGIYQGNNVVLMKGESKVHSNLIPGERYFLNDSELSTSETSQFVGIALSATTLLVPKYLE